MSKSAIKGKAPLIRFILIAGAFLFFLPSLLAQYDYNDNCQHTYQAILSLQFAEARKLIDTEKKADPANLLPVYFENYIDYLTLFIGEDRSQYELLKGRMSDRITRLEHGRQDSPYYRFCLAQGYLQWASARLKFGDYTAAAFEIRKAHLLFTENKEKYPDFLINNLGLGIVHVVGGIVPESYRWIAGIMGVDGSVEGGLNEIRRVAGYAGPDKITSLYRPEASFYLAFLAGNLQKNKKDALPVIRFLIAQNTEAQSKSPLMIFAGATILMKNGLNDEALALLQEREALTMRFPFVYLDYLEGMARLNNLDFSALHLFEQFSGNFRGQNYIRSAYQKMAWIALLRGDTARYRQTLKLVLVMGVSVVDEDKQAYSEAASGVLPNVILLRARLLFDGGYYHRSMKELLDNSISRSVRSTRDLIEYNYRLGRIYHETGNYGRAVEYYRLTIQRGKTEPYYFAASAAYQMGLLFENRGEWSKADSAYRLCLTINTPEYKASLGQKAKAGLIRVKKTGPKT